MADFVLVYDRQDVYVPRAGTRTIYYGLAYYDLVATPISGAALARVPVTPASDVPALAQRMMSSPELTSLTNGLAGFELHERVMEPDLFPEVLIARVRKDFATTKAKFIERWQQRVAGYGLRIMVG